MISKVRNLFLITSILGCSIPQIYQAKWFSSTAHTPASIFHSENALTLTVNNDSTYLYVMIDSRDKKTVEKIQNLGLSIWLSKGNTPHQDFGIHYPLPYEDVKGKIALEGFSQASLTALTPDEIFPIEIKTNLIEETMHYQLKIPLVSLHLSPLSRLTISLSSFTKGKIEYISGLTSREVIERRIETYKAHPESPNQESFTPFFASFQLAKNPNKNP